MQSNNFEKLVHENLVDYGHGMEGSSYWMSRRMPRSMTLMDVLKMDKAYQLKKDFKNVIEHPLVRKDKEKKEALDLIDKKIGKIVKAWQTIFEDIEKLRLE